MGAEAATRGDAIRDARLAKGLSVATAAEGITSPTQWAAFEAGHAPTPPDAEPAITQRLGLDAAFAATLPSLHTRIALEAAVRTGDWKRVPVLLERLDDNDVQRGLYLGLLQEHDGDLPLALEVLEPWMTTQPPCSLPWTRGRTAMCRCSRDSGQVTRAIEIGEHTLAALNEYVDADPEAVTELRSTLAGAYCETGNLERALELTAAPGTGRELPPWAEVTRCWARAMALHVAGRTDEARDTAFEGLRILKTLNRPLALARLRNVAAWLAMQAVHFDADQLEELLRDAEETVRSDDSKRSLAALLSTRAELMARAGDRASAEELLAEAQGLVMTEDAGDRARVLAACAQVYGSMGDIDEAVRLLLLARQLLEDSGAKRSAAATWRQMADIYTTLQQPDLALACMQAAMDLLEL